MMASHFVHTSLGGLLKIDGNRSIGIMLYWVIDLECSEIIIDNYKYIYIYNVIYIYIYIYVYINIEYFTHSSNLNKLV